MGEHFANIMVDCFMEAADKGMDLVAVVADSTSTSKIKPFMEKFPERVINVGIAEQTMVGTAAGLALGGKIAVTCNAAPFLIARANEQVKVDICYNNTNVKMFGLNAGTSYGSLASTHHSIDDISVMRGFGNVEIYAPSCPIEARQIIDYALHKTGPVYIRMDGKALPKVHGLDYQFKPGQIDVLRQGHSVVIVALGSVVHEAVCASDALAEQGLPVSVVNLSSLRPLDKQALGQILAKHENIITVEEHNINGGLGSIVAETLAENAIAAKLWRFGVKDGQYAPAGSRAYTRDLLGISAEQIIHQVKQLY